MTVEKSINLVRYEGNGSAYQFPVPYRVLSKGHIRLFRYDIAAKVQTEITSGYEVIGVPDGPVSVSLSAPLATGMRLTIVREVPYLQLTDITNGDDFHAEVLEGMGDDLEMQIQQIAEICSRAITISVSDENPPKTAEDFYEDMQGFADAAAESAARSEAAADKSEQMYEKVRETGDTAVTHIREAEVQALGAIGSAGVAEVERVRREGKAWTEAACACAQTACECADDAWRAVASIPGIEAAQFTINALNIVDGVLVWSQGRAGAVMRVSDYDWCSGPEHASIYYTLNNQGEVVRRLPVAPPAIIGG
ncbi:hypothetical protein LJC46_04375 [Desulfovibrio sp. OttesenSCG-928-G15]|nr:hypothetical protein [Desulfovibrio sp. OttesenSCG-928-G15]